MSTKEIREALEQMRINFLIEINQVIDSIGFENQNKIKLPIETIISTDSEEFKKKYTEFLQVSAKNAPTEKEEEMPGVSVSNIKGDTEMNFKNEIYERKSGLYEYKETINGVRISVCAQTKTELWDRLMARKKDIKKEPAKKQTLTFYEWLDKWFKLYKENKISESTQNNYLSYIKRIKEKIKNRPLNKLQALPIQEFLNKAGNPRTQKAFYDLLKDCLSKAELLKLLKDNPMPLVSPASYEKESGTALSKTEEQSFETALNGLENKELVAYYRFCKYSGGRRSEVLGVEWNGIDFEKLTVRIPGTKNQTSDRVIPLFDSLKAVISGLNNNGGKLFDFKPDYVSRTFSKLMPKRHLHELRHTFATRCLESGVSMKTLQLWLGHSTYEQTANTYSHILEAFNKTESDKINKPTPDNSPDRK